MAQQRAAMLAMIGACLIWGFSPLYFRALNTVPPGELLAHRVLWSLLLFLAILALGRRLGTLRAALRGRRLAQIAAAAVMVSANWLIFIVTVFQGHVVQSSLGYYIFPLISVLIGMVVFGERLGRLQAIAVALAVAAVLTLALGLGVPPWFSLGIGGTFAVYGAIKKGLDLPPLVSVTAELVVLAPAAILWLALRPEVGANPAPIMGHGWTPVLLIGSSLMTALPLMLFSGAARRLGLATVGLMQYLNPTLQFLVATLWFHEPFTRWHVLSFLLIWAALGLYSAGALGQRRRSLPARPARL